MNRRLLCLCIAVALVFGGCATLTRTETETYTIVMRDTTMIKEANNAPGQRENGVVYPSTRMDTIEHPVTEYDSTHDRYYPNFLRAGVFEAAGLFGTGNSSNGIGGGLFGVYGLADSSFAQHGNSKTFTGEMLRFFPYETRLRWFHDSPNWTIGTAAYEIWAPEADFSKAITGIFPIYIRKRYFLREQIPYVIVEPTVGIGIIPTPMNYINLGVTLDVGSLGGMNFHAYLGYIAGTQLFGQLDSSLQSHHVSQSSSFPYFGLGVSMLDFVNTVAETQHEWKDYTQSSLEVTPFNLTVLHSLRGDSSLFGPSSSFLTGIAARLATVEYPIWHFGGNVNIGTSLINFIAPSATHGGLGILPLRLGYRILLIPDELTNESFAEINYYPSSFWNIADRISLDLKLLRVNLTLGYVDGSRGGIFTSHWLPYANAFSDLYFGVGIGLGGHIFNLGDLTPW